MYERLLEPDSHEAPDCQCGTEMRLIRTEKRSEDAAVKHFECDACRKQLLIMVWPEAMASDVASLRARRG